MTPKQEILFSKLPQWLIDQLQLEVIQQPEDITSQKISDRVDVIISEIKSTEIVPHSNQFHVKRLVPHITEIWSRPLPPPRRDPRTGKIIDPF